MATKRGKVCPACGSGSLKVIYSGVPGRLCENSECRCLFGGWSWLLHGLPFNGWFMVYEGSYWRALWTWLHAGES